MIFNFFGGIQMDVEKKQISWGWIVFWCIAFWPVGIYLLVRRMNSDRTATLKNSGTVRTTSLVLMILGVFSVFSAFSSYGTIGTFFYGMLLFALPGILLYIKSQSMKEEGRKFQMYIAIVINQGEKSMEKISRAVGVTIQETREDLEKMIDRGYFPNTYIDAATSEIILPDRKERDMAAYEEEKQKNYRVITCQGCGAKEKIAEGQTKKCEYCGSLLQQ